MSKGTVYWIGLMFLAAGIYGQSTGSLTGTVTDQNEGALANATVKVYIAGGREPLLTATTNAAGRFAFASLDPDTYDVGVEASGFTPFTYRQVRVSPGQETALPSIRLQVAGVTQTIEVVAEVQMVQLDNAEVSTTLTNTQVQNLPVLGRQIYNLFETQPGVTNTGNPTTVNGLKASFANVTLDGINIQDNFIRTNDLNYAPFRTTIDQVAEITITTTNPSAAQGGGTSQFIIATKSGTNDYHGSLYWYNRNEALAARDWFSNRDDVPKTKLNLNQPGVALGGPVAIWPNKVYRDKLFFYANYEWYRLKQQDSILNTVLTQSARDGNFTYRDTGGALRTVNLRTLRNYTPNPYIAGLIAQTPLPNSPGGDGLNTGGYRFNAKANEFRDQFVLKMDYYATGSHSFSGTYNYIDNPTDRPDVGTFYGVTPAITNTLKNHLMSLNWRWTLTPTLTNEIRGGFARTKGSFDNARPYPNFALAGLLFTNPVNQFLNQGRPTNIYQVQDNAAWIKGNHQVSFGYQFQRVFTAPYNDAGILPTYTLGISTNNPNGLAPNELPSIRTTDLATANALYTNLAGIISAADQTFNVTSRTSGFVPGATNRRQLEWSSHALYIQDNWKVLRNLTVNLGLRYEYWLPLDEQNGLFLAPVLQNNDVRATLLNPNAVLDFIGSGSGRPFYNADKNNFAPNVGFAWDPFGTGKTSIRAGYMIAYANDNLVTTVRNNVNTSSGLQFSNTVPGLVASLSNPPQVPAPTYKVPRTLADNYAISTFSAIGIPDPNLRTPYVQQWNVSIEREVMGVFLTARYVGNDGADLLRAVDYNQVLYNAQGFLADFKRAQANGDLALARTGVYNPSYNPNIPGSQQLTVFPQLVAGGLLTNATVINLIRTGQVGSLADIYQTNRLNGPISFYTNPNIQGGNTVANLGSSSFHSLQLEGTKRTRFGLQAQFSYVYGKSLSNQAGDGQTNFEPFLDNANPGIEKARSPFDIRHAFKANYYYELPYGTGKRWSGNRLLNQVLGGWALAGIWSYQSGSPFSVLSTLGTLNRGGALRSGANNTASIVGTSGSQLRSLANGVYKTGDNIYFISPSVINSDGRGTNQPGTAAFNGQVFFNPDAGTVGNLQRRYFSGPWNFAFDMSAIKTVRFGERHRVDLHFDFFNVFNHPTFYMFPSTGGDYGATSMYNINSTTFGQLFEINQDPRQIQIGLYYRF
jgi:hypothetical protein